MQMCSTLVALSLTAVVGQEYPYTFYPFGFSEGDRALRYERGAAAPAVNISVGFPYFNDTHRTVFVSINALICHMRESLQHRPD